MSKRTLCNWTDNIQANSTNFRKWEGKRKCKCMFLVGQLNETLYDFIQLYHSIPSLNG